MSVRPFVRSSVRLFVLPSVRHSWRVVVCVRFSSETTWPISPMMIPINWGNNVDVQSALHFDLDPSMTAGQGHEILRFCELFLLMGSSLCSLLLRYYSTDFSNDDTNQLREQCRCATDDTNQLREQCRCATCTSFWPWPPPWLQVKVTKYLDFVNYSHFSNDDTNQLREQCRCATCTSFWPWPLHDCRSRSQNTSILWI